MAKPNIADLKRAKALSDFKRRGGEVQKVAPGAAETHPATFRGRRMYEESRADYDPRAAARRHTTPNETTEMWKDVRHEQQERRAARLPSRQAEIFNLQREGYEVVELTPYQFRVNDVLDLYPTHRRFHHIPTKTRGTYQSARKTCAAFLGARQ